MAHTPPQPPKAPSHSSESHPDILRFRRQKDASLHRHMPWEHAFIGMTMGESAMWIYWFKKRTWKNAMQSSKWKVSKNRSTTVKQKDVLQEPSAIIQQSWVFDHLWKFSRSAFTTAKQQSFGAKACLRKLRPKPGCIGFSCWRDSSMFRFNFIWSIHEVEKISSLHFIKNESDLVGSTCVELP